MDIEFQGVKAVRLDCVLAMLAIRIRASGLIAFKIAYQRPRLRGPVAAVVGIETTLRARFSNGFLLRLPLAVMTTVRFAGRYRGLGEPLQDRGPSATEVDTKSPRRQGADRCISGSLLARKGGIH